MVRVTFRSLDTGKGAILAFPTVSFAIRAANLCNEIPEARTTAEIITPDVFSDRLALLEHRREAAEEAAAPRRASMIGLVLIGLVVALLTAIGVYPAVFR